ncbi:MAG: phosphopyruvate hydratase, partial [Nanoarchaeota archaeon]|nr:phosphopyruvate hydratase [Nanoarchaeota archaeon]
SIGAGASVSNYAVNPYPENFDKLVSLVNKTFNKDLKGIRIEKFEELEKIERYVKSHDFSESFEKIGGNVLVALELAVLKAASDKELYTFLNKKVKKLPTPLGNCVGGGKHGQGPDFQEFLILPQVKKFDEACQINIDVYKNLKEELKKHDRNFVGAKTTEGGWSCSLSNLEVLSIMKKVVNKVGDEYNKDVKIGLDIAGDSLWNGRKYEYKKFSRVQQKRNLSKEDQVDIVRKIIRNHKLAYVEDPLNDGDFDGFKELKKENCLICGDDLIATNPERLELSKDKISAVIIKPNQIGSLLKTKEVIDIAKKNKIIPVMSHRSGETTDNAISHLAVGWECNLIKTGIIGGERVSKLNELLRISELI